MCEKLFYVLKNTWKITILVIVEKLWETQTICPFFNMQPSIYVWKTNGDIWNVMFTNV